MTTSDKLSVMFETANGRKVEVTRQQIEKVTIRLWSNEDMNPQSIVRHHLTEDKPSANYKSFIDDEEDADKENQPEVDFFDDTFEDDLDDFLTDSTNIKVSVVLYLLLVLN